MQFANVNAKKIAGHISLKNIKKKAQLQGMQSKLFPEALVIQWADQIAVFFSRGVLVEWTSQPQSEGRAEKLIEDALNEHHTTEEYNLEHGESFAVNNDTLTIDRWDTDVLVVISHALARSVQIDYDDIVVNKLLSRTGSLPTSLKTTGKIRMSERRIRKMIGSLLESKHALNTFSQVDDHPELLWDDPSLRQYYRLVATDLELKDRWSVVQNKVSTVEETLDILRDEVNTKHGHFLEIVIILLFVFDILVYLFFG